MTIRRRLIPYWLLAPGALWLTLFFVVPMGFMAEQALESGALLTGGFTFSWEWSNFPDSLSGNSEQIVRSFYYAGAATILALLIAYPLAYAIAQQSARWRLLLLFAVIAPFFTTYLIRTIAWQTILSDESAVVDLLKTVGLVADDGRVLDTAGSVIAGLTYNFLPFMVLPIYVSLEKIDPRLLDAARDLFSNPFRGFRKVVLPLSLPGIFAGSLLVFIPAAGDFVNSALLGSPQTRMIGNVVQGNFLSTLDYPSAAAISFVLMAIITVLVLVYSKLLGTEELTV